jgi:signal transduction histidine kinase
VTFYPQFSEQGVVHNVVCYAKNITEKKEVERRIQQTEKLVAVGQLAAGVAHEINNPLGVILCYTDLLKENNQDNAATLADITVIERHTENCRRIVADLLDFSRSRKAEINKQPASINSIIDNVLSMVHQQFLKKQINLCCTFADNIPSFLVDSRRMKQVLLNLIMNAGQAIGSGGDITIRTRTENSSVLVEIEDSGPGISKDILDKIFDPFFSTKEPGEGTGLGLSVSYGIIQEHDGEISVQSSPGHGALFTIRLPIAVEGEPGE